MMGMFIGIVFGLALATLSVMACAVIAVFLIKLIKHMVTTDFKDLGW